MKVSNKLSIAKSTIVSLNTKSNLSFNHTLSTYVAHTLSTYNNDMHTLSTYIA